MDHILLALPAREGAEAVAKGWQIGHHSEEALGLNVYPPANMDGDGGRNGLRRAQLRTHQARFDIPAIQKGDRQSWKA